MRRRGYFLASSLVFALIIGCATPQVVPLEGESEKKRPAVAPEKVSVFRNADVVPGSYQELAMIDAVGDTEEAMMNSLREMAGEVGANGVILESVEEGLWGEKMGRAVAILIQSKPSKAKGSTSPKEGEKRKEKEKKEEPWA